MTLSGLLARLCMSTQMWRTSNPRALARTNEGEWCRLCVLPLPWPTAPLASSLLAGLRKEPLQNSMRLSARHLGQRGTRAAVSRRERPPQGKAMHRVETPPREGARVFDRLEGKQPMKGTGTAEGGTCQNTKGKRPIKGWTGQDMERKQPGEGHSPSETTKGLVRTSPYILHPRHAHRPPGYCPHRGRVLLLPDRRSHPAALHWIGSPDYLRGQGQRVRRGHHFPSRSGMKLIKRGARAGEQGEEHGRLM